MKEIGIITTITGAMNQAFFTLSLGIGAMAIFGSYIGKDHALLGESVNIAILDTFVAITSGLIIFPACFTFNVDQTSGPSLIFITLPNISTTFHLEDSGEACSSSLCHLQHSPPSWLYLKILFPVVWSLPAGAVRNPVLSSDRDHPSFSAMRSWLQRMELERIRCIRRCGSRLRGFPGKQPSASAWLSCIPAFLRFQTWLGLGKLHKRSQHRKRHEDPEMDARIHHLYPAADHSVYLLLWSVR